MVIKYFVATIKFEDVKFYLNQGGVWGDFSIGDTVFAPTIKALNYHYHKWNRCYIEEDDGAAIEKVSMVISFEETKI